MADAFHNVPVRQSERRFACGKVGESYVCFTSLCMGGKSAPNIWGRFAAAMGRITASILPPDEHRLEIYVDDPLLCATGDLERRTFLFSGDLEGEASPVAPVEVFSAEAPAEAPAEVGVPSSSP